MSSFTSSSRAYRYGDMPVSKREGMLTQFPVRQLFQALNLSYLRLGRFANASPTPLLLAQNDCNRIEYLGRPPHGPAKLSAGITSHPTRRKKKHKKLLASECFVDYLACLPKHLLSLLSRTIMFLVPDQMAKSSTLL
jgi:hypothetical protein